MPRVDDAMQADISHMRENMCVTWTVNELYEVYIANGGILGQKLMLVHLHEYVAEDFI